MRARAAGQSALLVVDVVDVLNAQQIAYAVIGALAASVHGAVRASMDADVVLSASLHEATKLARTFEAAGFRTALVHGDPDDPIPALLQVTDAYSNRVDLLFGLRGLDPQAFSRAIDVPFQGSTLRFIGREDFVAMKVFAGGPVDLLDADRAIAADRKSLDLPLVRRLTKRYGRGASEALERLLADES